MTIRIILADDHAMLTEGLAALLAEDGSCEVVATAGDGRQAVRRTVELRPDVVVMDVGMKELSGIEATRQIVQRCPATKVVGLSMHKDRRFVAEMLGAGATGYVVKDSLFDELVTAIRRVAAGEGYLSPTCTGVVIEDYVKRLGAEADRQDGSVRLSPREREVLQLIAEGCSTKEIAARLCLSPKTVETHRRQLMEKLGIFSVAGLVRYALREGLTTLEP